jgi:hypothetical protein
LKGLQIYLTRDSEIFLEDSIMVRARFVFPVVLLSVVAAIGLTVEWWREQHPVQRLVIAAGSSQGERGKDEG